MSYHIPRALLKLKEALDIEGINSAKATIYFEFDEFQRICRIIEQEFHRDWDPPKLRTYVWARYMGITLASDVDDEVLIEQRMASRI